MLEGAREGSIVVVDRQIRLGCSVNDRDSHGWTVARVAAVKGHLSLLQSVIVEHRAHVEYAAQVPNCYGDCLLQLAVVSGNVEMCSWLVHKLRFDPHGTDSRGRTLYMVAAWASQLGVAKYFLDEFDADPSAVDSLGMNAFHLAAQTLVLHRQLFLRLVVGTECRSAHLDLALRNRAVMEWLLECGSALCKKRTEGGDDALMLSLLGGCADTVTWLLRSVKVTLTSTSRNGTRAWEYVADRIVYCTRDSVSMSAPASAEVMMLQSMCFLGPVTFSPCIAGAWRRYRRFREHNKDAADDVYMDIDVQGLIRAGGVLRESLPLFLEQQGKLLVEHLPLLRPLLEVVKGYAEPTVEDAWSAGLNVPVARKRRPRPAGVPTGEGQQVRRSARQAGRPACVPAVEEHQGRRSARLPGRTTGIAISCD
jgi:hypothetical protein